MTKKKQTRQNTTGALKQNNQHGQMLGEGLKGSMGMGPLLTKSLFPTFLLVVLVVVGVPCTNISGTANTVAYAAPSDDTGSKVGLGFSTTPGPTPTGIPTPTPTGTVSPTVAPTKAPTPTPSQSSPVIPDPNDPPTTNQTPINVGTNLAKTGWVNTQTWLLTFALLGSVFLCWAFLLIRRERDEQEENGLVVVANVDVDKHNDQLVGSGNSGFGLGEDK